MTTGFDISGLRSDHALAEHEAAVEPALSGLDHRIGLLGHVVKGKALDRHQQRALLRQALQELPPRQREVVTLRIDAELSFRDIGETVGTTEATARVNFHHGMKRLRDMMRAQGETHPESPGTTSRNRRTP